MKKKMQFSQKFCVALFILAIFIIQEVLIGSFLLSWSDKQPLSDVAISAVSIFGGFVTAGGFGGYLALSGVRDCSKNKHADKLSMDTDVDTDKYNIEDVD